MIITIDGPAGTGKTTIARLVAERLGFHYFDTGAMYRALTYQLLKHHVSVEDKERLLQVLKSFEFDVREEDGQKRYYVDKEDVTQAIRSPEVTSAVSNVAAHREIRFALVAIQRKFGEGKRAVFEGRDMGTVVFPKAEIKIFLTARPEIRAKRRYLEFKMKDMSITEADVLKEILGRDHVDSTREVSPLMQADDAILIDTSDLSIDEVVEKVLSLVRHFNPPL